MGTPKKKPDPTYTLRLISIINRMRNNKQRASVERITYYMGHYYGLNELDTVRELNSAVNAGLIMKFIGLKGKESYRDSKFPKQLPSQSFVRKYSADLRMLVAMAIETINSASGSKISAVEEHIRTTHALDLSRADITSQLKLAVNHGIADGLFFRNGPFIKVNCKIAEELKQKDTQNFFAEGVEPSPVCGFCLGTSEYNKDKNPEQLLSCVDCGNSGHPSCLKFSADLTRQCMSEPWQCIECKVCSFCRHSGDADNLLFCDSCDKGYHMDCLQPAMAEMPKGFWMCCLCERNPIGKTRKRRNVVAFSSPEVESEKKLVKPCSDKKVKKHVKPNQCEREYSENDPMSDVKIIQGIMQAEERKKKKKNRILNHEDKVEAEESQADIEATKKKKKKKKKNREQDNDTELIEKVEEKKSEVNDDDRELYEKIIQKCNKALEISPAETTDQHLPKFIDFGQYEIETWYSSPLPFEYSRLTKLYFCEYCLKYMKSKEALQRHESKCTLRQPPANEIYRHNGISLYEADGAKNKLYCRNLCLLAKMFLDHKTLYYDVEPFLFYVLTKNDSHGAHLVGYFSKEKTCVRSYNLSCIMTLPHTQRQGYGKLLIDFSYVLSKLEGKPGTPEKPLSDLGLISYRSYWRQKVLLHIEARPDEDILITDISNSTGILYEDIVLALHDLELLDYDDKCEQMLLNIDKEVVSRHLKDVSKYHAINEDALLWSPLISASYGVSSQRRSRKTAENCKSPPRMLLSPMKVIKNVDKLDIEDPVVEEPRPIDTFTKYYPNWIPAGEDADEYRYTGDQEKGEIESFVMKKTPGRKKRVKFAVVYNPKSGKRFTRAIPKKKNPAPKPVMRSLDRHPSDQTSTESSVGIETELANVTDIANITDIANETDVVPEAQSNSPAISYNEVSSTSDNIVVTKDTSVDIKLESLDCELPHSTTEDPVSTIVSDAGVLCTAGSCSVKKRQHSSDSESTNSAASKKVKLETSFIEYTDSDSEDELPKLDDTEAVTEADTDTHADPNENGEGCSKEDDDNLMFLNTFSNIYVKSPDCLKPSESNTLSSSVECFDAVDNGGLASKSSSINSSSVQGSEDSRDSQ